MIMAVAIAIGYIMGWVFAYIYFRQGKTQPPTNQELDRQRLQWKALYYGKGASE